ncbi:MAG TPA: amino acid adenylation domain-containing protein, partial [Thermoanaerobaculia bacterium]
MYNQDLFDATRIARLRGHFANLLEAALGDPDRGTSSLPLLGEAERHQVLREWSDSRTGRPAGICVHELFADQAARTPGAVAAVCGGEELTYRELLDRSRRWAAELAGRGVGPESVVAILSPRGLPFLTAVLAVFQAGGVYLPLDPHQPPARALSVLRQSGARWLLSGGGLGPRLLVGADDPLELDLLELEDFARLEDGGAPPARRSPAGLEHLAYVIFTSGSTGLPKGAMVHHRGLLNHLLAKIGDLGITAADTVAQNASQSFDISVWQMLSPLVVGGRVAIYPDAVAHDPAGLLAAVEHDGVTVLEVVPSMLVALLEGDGVNAGRLRWLVPTGEALPPELARRWLARHPGIPLLNAYGPTECSDDVSHGPVREAPPLAAASVPIGRPVVNTGLYVVDGDLRPQPLGVPGELCVGGEGVGRGYLGEPGKTAQAFVPDPFGGAPGARLYHTGDLARWLPSGEIEFLGRIDHQIKVRGFRIELGEIEAALASHPAVRQVVVDPRGEGAGRRLVAYVVNGTEEDPEDFAAALREHLQSRLPDYMIPSAFVYLAELPLTPNGKVDRKALPAPDATPAAGEPVAPRTPLEIHLAGLWREALGVESVGIHESFFDLGGSSITGAVMINRLQREIGEILHVVVIFDAPTVAKMATYLAREHREAVVRLWGAESLGEQAADASVRTAGRIDAAKVAEIRALIPSLPPASRPEMEKNPPAVFVLSPPRSGSTLLRVMLGGHPGLFAPPELELLSFDTLAERKAAFPGRDSFWL